MRFPAFILLRFTFPHYDRSFFALNGALAVGKDQKCSLDHPCSLNDKYRASREEAIQEEVVVNLEGGHYEIFSAIIFRSRKLKINGAGASIRCVEPSDGHDWTPTMYKLEMGAFRFGHDARVLNASILDVIIWNCTTAFFMKSDQPVHVVFRNVSWVGNWRAVQIEWLSHAHFDIQDCAIRDGVFGFDVASADQTILNFSRTDFDRTRRAIKVYNGATHVSLSEGRMTNCEVACIALEHSSEAILEVDRYVFENSGRGISIVGDKKKYGLYMNDLRIVVTRTKFDRNQDGFVTEMLRNSHVVFGATKFTASRNTTVSLSLSRDMVVTFYDCEFRSNQAEAIKFIGEKNITISVSDCSVSDNAMYGLLVRKVSKITVKVVGSSFSGNSHQGIHLVDCKYSDVDIDRCIFQRSRNGMLIDSSKQSALQLTKSNFTHNVASGVEILYSEASLVVDGGSFSYNGVAGVQVARRKPNGDDSETGGHVKISNAVVRKNSLAGVLLEGLRINAHFTDSSVNDNGGVGVSFDGGDTGSSSFKRCEILRNPLGSRFRVEMLSFQDSVILGSEDGIKIDYADAVKLENVTVTDNVRGISCPSMHLYRRPTRKYYNWTVVGFIYLNAESDVNCKIIQRLAFVPNFITRFHFTTFFANFTLVLFITLLTFMLPPVLETKPIFFETPRSIRDRWPSASWSYRIVTSFTIALGGILAAAMFLFLQAVQYMPSRKATRVSWIAIYIILFAIAIGCTGRLVSEMVIRRWTVMSASWRQTQEQKRLLKKKLHLQTQIRNVELKKELAVLQYKARKAVLNDGGISSLAEGLFRKMKAKAEEENRRLGEMARERRFLYDAEPGRMAYLVRIPSERVSEPVQEDVGVNQDPDDDEGYLRYIHEQAEWFLPEFSRILRRIVYCFNRIGDVRDLESLGLLPEGSSSEFRLSFEPDAHKLKPDRHATVVGINCALRIGGVKRIERALAKVKSDYCNVAVGAAAVKPVSRHVCDWLRATVITEDPYTLALLFHVFKHVLGLVRVKNNFANASGAPVLATNLLANFRLCWREDVHVVEIQFMLQDFLSIRLVQHDYYDILRAESMPELCAKPVFDALSDDEEEEDLVEKIAHGKLFSKVISLRNQSNGASSFVRVSRASNFASVPTMWGSLLDRLRASRRLSVDEDGTDARCSTAMTEDSLGALRFALAGESTQNDPNIELADVVDRRTSLPARMSSNSIRGVWRGRSERSGSSWFPLDD